MTEDTKSLAGPIVHTGTPSEPLLCPSSETAYGLSDDQIRHINRRLTTRYFTPENLDNALDEILRADVLTEEFADAEGTTLPERRLTEECINGESYNTADEGLPNAEQQADCEPTSLRERIRTAATDPKVRTVAKCAAGGAVTTGGVGGAVGGIAGGFIGAAVGFVPAVFTFGLSIPAFAIIGSGLGLGSGALTGSVVGLVGGAGVGGGIAYRQEVRQYVEQTASSLLTLTHGILTPSGSVIEGVERLMQNVRVQEKQSVD